MDQMICWKNKFCQGFWTYVVPRATAGYLMVDKWMGIYVLITKLSQALKNQDYVHTSTSFEKLRRAEKNTDNRDVGFRNKREVKGIPK